MRNADEVNNERGDVLHIPPAKPLQSFECDLFNLVTLKGLPAVGTDLLFSARNRVVSAMLEAFHVEVAKAKAPRIPRDRTINMGGGVFVTPAFPDEVAPSVSKPIGVAPCVVGCVTVRFDDVGFNEAFTAIWVLGVPLGSNVAWLYTFTVEDTLFIGDSLTVCSVRDARDWIREVIGGDCCLLAEIDSTSAGKRVRFKIAEAT